MVGADSALATGEGRAVAVDHSVSPLAWQIPVLVGVITVAGLLLRLPSFGDSLFVDEVGAYWIVTGHGLGQVLHLMGGQVPSPELNPPLWFVFAWASEKVFGASAESLKLVSLLAGTATIPMTYMLGRRTVGVRAGLVACALVALSPFLIFYSTEARPYALLVFLGLLSTLALLRALDTGGRRWWALYAVCACGVAYTHYTGVFLLVGQFIWAFIAHPKARRALTVASAAAAIAFIPWVPSLIKTTKSPGTKLYGQLEPFSWHWVRLDLGHWAIGHPYLTVSRVPGQLAAWLIVGGVALGALGAALALRSARRLHNRVHLRRDVVLVLVLAFSAPVGAAIYSELRESVWGARNIISSWPGFAVLVGALLMYARAPFRIAAVALVIAGFAIGGLKLSQTSNQRPDYQSAAAYIDRTDHGTAPVVEAGAASPGPPTETEAALALDQTPQRHQVLRIGLPPLNAVLHAPAYTRLPVPSGEVIAHEAAALAGNGTLFIVVPTTVTIARLETVRRRHIRGGTGALGIFASFLGALPERFRPVTSRTFPGSAPITVYVFRG